MKIKKQSKRKLIIASAVIVVAVAMYGVIALKLSYWPFLAPTVNLDGRQDTINESPKNNNPVKKDDNQPEINPGKTPDQVPINEEFVASITQLEQIGDNIKFAAEISNSPSIGTCVVTFTNANDRPVTKQFSATPSNNSMLCGPMDIPALEFSYLGEWTVSLRYYVGSEQAIASGKVIIK